MAKVNAIEKLLQRGLAASELIAYMLPGIAWLAEHQDDTFRLCYHDSAGAVVVETVAAPALITRARELEWTPEEPDTNSPQYMFGEAIYHCRRGVHWYATACDDSTQMLPLAFPKSVLEAAKKRDERLAATFVRRESKRQKAAERKLKNQVAEQEREAAAELKAAVQVAADDFMADAFKTGKPITPATARRKAWKHIRKCDDWTYHLLLKRLREMKAKGELA